MRAFPENFFAEFAQVLAALSNRQEVIASDLTQFAGETGRAIGEEDLRLAIPTRIEQNLTGGRMAGVILKCYAGLPVAQGNPGGFAAPARVDEFVVERQQLLKAAQVFGAASSSIWAKNV